MNRKARWFKELWSDVVTFRNISLSLPILLDDTLTSFGTKVQITFPISAPLQNGGVSCDSYTYVSFLCPFLLFQQWKQRLDQTTLRMN